MFAVMGVIGLTSGAVAFAGDAANLLKLCKKECPEATTEKEVLSCVADKNLDKKNKCAVEAKKHAAHQEGHAEGDGHSH
jgi:hypothetical protein